MSRPFGTNESPPAAAPPADLLATILAATRRIVAVRESHEALSDLRRRADATAARPGRLLDALQRRGGVNVIAECKRRSPSRGVLRTAYDPVAIARAYQDGGAAAISVLTEPTFFDGDLEHLRAVRKVVGLPILRKDFIVSEYQVLETRAAGADAALLIAAALPQSDLARLVRCSSELGLDALVEVHDLNELQRALDAGAQVVGVNNRNLRTLAVDTSISDRLIARMPADVIAVSESGLGSAGDVTRLRRLGYHAFLIGEHFMTCDDPGAALRGLLRDVESVQPCS